MEAAAFDVIVVGSGASGSMAAKELTERGLSVALIEAGREITAQDLEYTTKKWKNAGILLWQRALGTLTGQFVQAKGAFFSQDSRHLFVSDVKHPYTTTWKHPYLWVRGRQLGGRLHVYGRMLLRWSDYDFRSGDIDGKSENWPISYSDLAPHYDAVEEFLGIYGSAEGIPNLPDGVYAGRSELNGPEQFFKGQVEGKWAKRHVVPWRFSPKNGVEVTPSPLAAAIATGRLKIFTKHVARRVLTENSGAVAVGVETVDALSKEVVEFRGKVIMLCCSPVETSRLLLNSASKDHPDGLANSSGVLGRYFMDQVPSFALGTIPKGSEAAKFGKKSRDELAGKQGGAFIPRWCNLDGQTEQFSRGFAFQGEIGRSSVPDDQEQEFGFMGFGEMLPYADNRVTLHPHIRDRWGVPIPHIRCAMGENELCLIKRQTEEISSMLREGGLDLQWVGSPLGLQEFGLGAYPQEDILSRFVFRRMFTRSMTIGAAIHESGGARMGADPKSSVLNAHNETWDVSNLFVTDASAFPTSGTVGTTLTIMALTRRACEHIATRTRG